MLVHTHHTECSCIELIALFAVLWLGCGIFPPFLLPKQQPPVVQGFLNTKRSIRAFGTPQKGAKSLFYHPQEPFFFFFSFLEMVNKAPKPLAEFPKEPGNAFPPSAILNLVTLNANHYPAPTPALSSSDSLEGVGQVLDKCVDLGPSLTSELSTEGRESVSGVD